MARKQPDTLPDDRRHYVTDNINLVHHTIQRYLHLKPHNRGYDDMFQSGCVGLVKAAINFDPDRGIRFSTYAVSLIFGECQRYKRDALPVVKTSRGVRGLLSSIVSLKGDGYTDDEIIAKLGITSLEYSEACSTYQCISTDQPIQPDATVTIGDKIPMDFDLDTGLVEGTFLETLDKVLESYRENHPEWCDIFEDFVCSCIFDDKPTQMELAAKYRTSQAQVSRILSRLGADYRNQLEGIGVT